MILNDFGHFASKSVICLGLSIKRAVVFWLLDKTVRKFAEHIILSGSAAKGTAGTLVTGDIISLVGVLYCSSLKRERQTGELYSQLSHLLCTHSLMSTRKFSKADKPAR